MTSTPQHNDFYEILRNNIKKLTDQFDQIQSDRKAILKELSGFIKEKIKANQKIELTFICTHNSRRSHISQIWAQAAASYYGINNVFSYSGGTEATAFNPRAVKAMEEVGFKILKTTESENPVYEIYYSDTSKPVISFSKKYDAEYNPQQNFIAVMTCSHADENCPLVVGAAKRISLNYNDPKDFDGTPQESAKYSERVSEIGREILFVFSEVK
jgi:arsenate reductase (thioredoxin)